MIGDKSRYGAKFCVANIWMKIFESLGFVVSYEITSVKFHFCAQPYVSKVRNIVLVKVLVSSNEEDRMRICFP